MSGPATQYWIADHPQCAPCFDDSKGSASPVSRYPAWLRTIPAVELLRQVWVQNFYCVSPAASPEPGSSNPAEDVVRWRTDAEGFPASLLMIASPYDAEAHYAKKRTTTWIGYKVHLTESCDAVRPHLITHVETTPAPVVDRDVLERVHAVLAERALLPGTHLVDSGYVGAEQLVASRRDHGVTLCGPTLKDQQWQAQNPQGFRLQDFRLDWENQVATCPAGHVSRGWSPDINRGRAVMKVRFSTTDCQPCPLKPRCTRSTRRLLTLRWRDEYNALTAARAWETEAGFAIEYRRRAGIEGTISAGVHAFHLRRTRYIGLVKTHLQHVLTAAAMNMVRLAAWLGGTPLARIRQSAFARLMMQPAGA